MTPEQLLAAYDLSAKPYIEGLSSISPESVRLKSWRYLLELNTGCNLKCALCMIGNRSEYIRAKGNQLMKPDLLKKIMDKIVSENPNSIVCLYGNNEPMLDPHFVQNVAEVKSRGVRVELASNLNLLRNPDELLKVPFDLLVVGLSGFDQSVYSKSHRGGDIEKVKRNLERLKEAYDRMQSKSQIVVNFHKYTDNLDDIPKMKAFTESLGFRFIDSLARSISVENTVQWLRWLDEQKGVKVEKYGITKDGLDLNKSFPSVTPEFLESIKRLQFSPERCRDLYQKYPISEVCIIADVFTYIRHDGQVQLCAWSEDRRLLLGNYLDMTQEQLSEARRGHPFCRECLKYRLNLYYHIVDYHKWEENEVPTK